jgi:hypothetical protein
MTKGVGFSKAAGIASSWNYGQGKTTFTAYSCKNKCSGELPMNRVYVDKCPASLAWVAESSAPWSLVFSASHSI